MKNITNRQLAKKLLKSASRKSEITKRTRYKCWEDHHGELHWIKSGSLPHHTLHYIRVPDLDKFGTPDLPIFNDLLQQAIDEVSGKHNSSKDEEQYGEKFSRIEERDQPEETGAEEPPRESEGRNTRRKTGG